MSDNDRRQLLLSSVKAGDVHLLSLFDPWYSFVDIAGGRIIFLYGLWLERSLHRGFWMFFVCGKSVRGWDGLSLSRKAVLSQATEERADTCLEHPGSPILCVQIFMFVEEYVRFVL